MNGQSGARQLSRRLLGFGALPLVGALSPLLALPFVARQATPSEWATILTAQAIGGWLSTLIMFGESVQGPARIAVAGDANEQRAYYVASFQMRQTATVLSTLILGVIGLLLGTGEGGVLFVAMTLSSSLTGLSASWCAVGMGRPGAAARFDAIPRVIAMVLSALLVAVTGNLFWYPSALALASIWGPIAFGRRVFGMRVSELIPKLTSLSRYRSFGSVGALSMMGSIYAGAPLPLANALSTPGIAALGSADRIYRYALFSISTLGNALQAWVLNRAPGGSHRQRVALLMHAALGVIGAAVLIAAGPYVSRLLFGADVAGDPASFAGYALAFAAVSCSTPLVRNVFVPAGRARVVLLSTMISAATGVTAMSVLGWTIGAAGVALGAGLAELVNLVVLVLAAVMLRCRNSTIEEGRSHDERM